MTNLINSIIANQSLNPAKQDKQLPVFTFNSDGRIKPMKDKGRLLPSRIFGSPVEYAKDLKKEIVNIGKAAKGQANDHELGRINDLAMKLGSLGLATYLFIKNPLKLSKTMEFVGFGTFFGAMALWPKLAIQAPLKARTGVDIHQKYIDSQGRKKMLFQDPQYVLTDLYSKEDLNRIGNKMKVDKNLPDRDRFIKQRAQKTALQGNTLWMLTAGFASPLMSALTCNVLEKPIQDFLVNREMKATTMAIQTANYQGAIAAMRQSQQGKAFTEFLTANANKPLNDSLIEEISKQITEGMASGEVKKAVAQDLRSLIPATTVDSAFIQSALKDTPELARLSAADIAAAAEAAKTNPLSEAARILAEKATQNRGQQRQLAGKFEVLLEAEKQNGTVARPTLGSVKEKVQSLYEGMTDYAKGQGAVDRFIFARVGKQAGTYQAVQWGKFGDKLISALHLSLKDLKKIAESDNGGLDVIEAKLTELAKNPKKFDKTVRKLMKAVADIEKKTGENFFGTAEMATRNVHAQASEALRERGFTTVAELFGAAGKTGSVANSVILKAKEDALGARSSFYRVLQTLSLYKEVETKAFAEKLKEAMKNPNLDETAIARLTAAAKKIMLSATTTDYIEKLTSQGFGISEAEFKGIMTALFGEKSSGATIIEESLKPAVGTSQAHSAVKGFKEHLIRFKDRVVNWQNGITPELGKRTIEGAVTNSANGAERNALVGSTTGNTIKDLAKKAYNSKKWLYMFGGAMAVLTVGTIIAGLFLGRKGETEKQEEAKYRLNG